MFDAENRFFLKKLGSKDTSLVAACIPDERVCSADMELELLCLPVVSYFDFTRAMGGRHCEFRDLVLLPERGQPKGYYRRWGIFEEIQSAFFEGSHNQAPTERYVNGEEDMIVIM